MGGYKSILVSTSPQLQGYENVRYIKPISAHIVAGTNLFSDFFASFSDVFGGRSQSYQKQLSSLYSDAIEQLKMSAYELGANCVLGLHVDLDEISGKGKSMFMVTAIGTAVIVEGFDRKEDLNENLRSIEVVSIEKLQILSKRRVIIAQANDGVLELNDEIWGFIKDNKLVDVFDYIFNQFQKMASASSDMPETVSRFYRRILEFIDVLPDNIKSDLLYKKITSEEKTYSVKYLVRIINDLHLLDLDWILRILNEEDFNKRKIATRLMMCDKASYSKEDLKKLESILISFRTSFAERGARQQKRQLLSAKEKEVWVCDCGKTNDLNQSCSSCTKDIYGFSKNEITPSVAITEIEDRISLIKEALGVADR